MNTLSEKVAVVTGASKGIGAAIARALAQAGASVVVSYATDQNGAERVVAEIGQAGGRAVAVRGDVSKSAEAAFAVDAAIKNFGRLDVLVNNAGIYHMLPLTEIDEEHFHKIFNTNVLGLLLTTQAAAKHMRAGGSIINVGSVVSTLTPPQSVVYTATKGAVDSITGVLAKELGAQQIRVNSVNPGITDTEGTRAAGIIGSDFENGAVLNTPLGRTGRPSDIASVVVFLASDQAGWITGEHLKVSGGLH